MFQSKQKAVALKYDTERENAPVVVASGCGEVAKRIIDVAEKNGIPVYRDDSAASLMCMLQVGSSIPPELYEVVAGIYVSLLRSSKELRDKMLKGVDV
ncbi:MAG: EscU/YscU/HrcU family type III secretion system export apparatus switch protein [Ruminococcus sp.]|nr:EscU/YscU/HrcU family type III secretion system export apparatus switch protein [Ruminococcus sp.]